MHIHTRSLSAALWSLFTLQIARAFPHGPQQPEVQVGATTYVGSADVGLEQEFFGGIRYGEPPLGSLRLRDPVPIQSSFRPTTVSATEYGLPCIQLGLNASQQSEDCLNLNILRPAGLNEHSNLPVLVWIYGGGFYGGSASGYNGSALVATSVSRGTPMIYVNLNYRVGALGFPSGQEAYNEGALNLGIKDMRLALQWIQDNIRAFGGNGEKVTVHGASAGAISISVLMLHPSFSQLVRGAILESGSSGTAIPDLQTGRDFYWDAFVSAVPECKHLAHEPLPSPDHGPDYGWGHGGWGPTYGALECLRSNSISTEAVNAANTYAFSLSNEVVPFGPTLDGPDGIFPILASEALRSGQYARIPYIGGCQLDEGTAFVPEPQLQTTTALLSSEFIANYTPSVSSGYGNGNLDEVVTRLLELYPDNPALGSPFGTGKSTFGFPSNFKRAAAITGDVGFNAQRRQYMQGVSASGVPAYGYIFADPQPLYPPYFGVTHGAEVPYVYGELPGNALSEAIMNYWISFVVSQTPNDGKGVARPRWTAYSPHEQVVIQFINGNTTLIPDTFREEQIAYIIENALTLHF